MAPIVATSVALAMLCETFDAGAFGMRCGALHWMFLQYCGTMPAQRPQAPAGKERSHAARERPRHQGPPRRNRRWDRRAPHGAAPGHCNGQGIAVGADPAGANPGFGSSPSSAMARRRERRYARRVPIAMEPRRLPEYLSFKSLLISIQATILKQTLRTTNPRM